MGQGSWSGRNLECGAETEVEVPIAECNQAFFQTVATGTFGQVHIFSYAVTLPTPWAQTKHPI